MKIKSVYRALIICKKTDKYWFYFNFIYPIISGLIPVFSLWIAKEFIDALVLMIQGNNPVKIISLLMFQLSLLLLSTILEEVKYYVDLRAETRIGYKLEKLVLEKTQSIAFHHFDNPIFYNNLSRIQSAMGSNFIGPLRNLVELVRNVISIISVTGYLVTLHWIFIIFVIIPVIPSFIAKYKYGINKYKLARLHTPMLRDAFFTSKLLKERESVKEIRIFGLYKHLINRWSEKYIENAKKTLGLSKKQLYIELSIEIFKCLNFLFIVYFIIKLIKQNALSIGSYITVVQAVEQTQGSINRASDNIADILNRSLYLIDFFSFMDFEENQPNLSSKTIKSFPRPMNRGISIENATFSYINSSKIVLRNISLSINPGERIAIVGANGSGKSTLVKCILGLYSLQSGDIKFDNISINKISKKDLSENVTALFQDFLKYPYTLKENIGFGNINSINDLEKIKEQASITGVNQIAENLSLGYDTHLTKLLYDGEDLSGGQWQKVALTRALIRDSQVMILDEPTAALDPISEKEVFEQFSYMAKDKIAIFISHRMSAARLADRIIVMQGGSIIENDTFDNLMNKKGEFFKLYQLQAQNYNYTANQFNNNELIKN
ncbi:ATP-binding cassette domain-containing protein (plasmid) [Bacillus mycoides]|uniref:ABC transporter ATP-binding protein n=1 Tax=Bacillus mycoides TaxID=1405 RepID=UPI001C02C119|nr:ATP-binding cassette domain-containing protein [Bacillus mycoides]QWG59494.1 ATP-binding cassette domain-containing protein [Bacillus mycoides]